jgi:hypothetical protein
MTNEFRLWGAPIVGDQRLRCAILGSDTEDRMALWTAT